VVSSFDTNILLYAADRREPRKQKVAHELLRSADDAVILWQVVCEFIAASRKLAKEGLTTQEAWDQLSLYLRAYRPVLPSLAVLDKARSLHMDQGWSFWDAMIVAACLEAGVSRLYSEDLPGHSGPSGLEIINPFT
jgi:predicted nucleic acid-binding protein